MKYKITQINIHVYNNNDEHKITKLLCIKNVTLFFNNEEDIELLREKEKIFYKNFIKENHTILIDLTIHEKMTKLEILTHEFSRIGIIIMKEEKNEDLKEYYKTIDKEKYLVDYSYGKEVYDKLFELVILDNSKEYINEIFALYTHFMKNNDFENLN